MLVEPQKRDHLRAGCCALHAIFPGGEQFPVETRTVGVALAFSISLMIFGGFAPFIATWLIAQTGDPLSPSYYLMATALLSIIALMAIERRAPHTVKV